MRSLAFLRCPNCTQSKLSFQLQNPDTITQIHCRNCGYAPPIRQGIPDFRKKTSVGSCKVHPSQRLMNSYFFALLYESFFWRPLHTLIGSGISVRQELKEIFALGGSLEPHTIIDMAAGTGHYAREFSIKYSQAVVIGFDISLNMLLRGQKLIRQHRLTNNFLILGDIYRLPFDDESADWINCGGALHLFTNLDPIWKEVSRVLKPGGVFTGMTISLSPGPLGRVQKHMMRAKKATFFYPEHLAKSFNMHNLKLLKFKLHRMVLLFSAVKTPRKVMLS